MNNAITPHMESQSHSAASAFLQSLSCVCSDCEWSRESHLWRIHGFEIPATNLNRAADFYAKVVNKELIRQTMGPHEMAVFPYERTSGIGGCVLFAGSLKPSTTGSVVYLYVGKDLDAALERVWDAGGRVSLEKTALPGDLGHFAHIIDSEGNRVGLHAG